MSQINTQHTGLILISGVDAPGVTQALFSALEPFSITILDIEQVVIRGRLILTTLIALDPAHSSAIEDDLLIATNKLGLDLAIDFSDQPKGEVKNSNLHIVVLAQALRPAGIQALASKIAEKGGNIDRIHRTASYPLTAIELEVSLSLNDENLKLIQRELAEIAQSNGIDIAVELSGLARRAKRIVLLDMDSTLIQQEVIDLLAEKCGVGSQVASITQAAMQGELDFSESLKARVRLLAGADIEIINSVKAGITLTPGARTLIRTLHKLGHKVGVVSGGFLDVIEPLLQELQIDFYRANRLEIADGKLTGNLLGAIIDKSAKAEALREFAASENVALSQTIAIGDGANDLGMLEIAGLGIAFNAKPAVRAAATSSINSPYLDSVLYLMGITRSEIEDADRAN
ncbi:MAG: phosphoserine phosphatase SerB [Actinobacteria bacterium]|uniref:phosphoserine phosphatase n=1 Tax=freshwater metagenome TaxID=449393 RepID=A0A6J7KDY6_9ZZZZ|nr:phosphoserine phosphatase SerB [Actinomycetota bacterium]